VFRGEPVAASRVRERFIKAEMLRC
jgi:hypothetical protein